MNKKKSPPINQFLSSQDFKDYYEIWKAKELAENMAENLPKDRQELPEILAENSQNVPGILAEKRQELPENLAEKSPASQQAGNMPENMADSLANILPVPPATLPDEKPANEVTLEDLEEVVVSVQEQQVITKELSDEHEIIQSRIEELEGIVEELKAIPSVQEHLTRQSAWKKMKDYRESLEVSS